MTIWSGLIGGLLAVAAARTHDGAHASTTGC